LVAPTRRGCAERPRPGVLCGESSQNLNSPSLWFRQSLFIVGWNIVLHQWSLANPCG
jgi:hypothetical protein